MIEEVSDFIDVIQSKIERLTKNIDKLQGGSEMGGAERRKMLEGCERDIERINNDMRSI